MSDPIASENPDANVNDELIACLNLECPKSFFLFAGAGSGKTHSLVETLKAVRMNYGYSLRTRKRRIAVITYTKAASEEIKNRLGLDDLFSVSTIHSFLWEMIRPYQNDIRGWVQKSLESEITNLSGKLIESKNKNTKTYAQNEIKLKAYQNRLEALPTVKAFSYNPNGENKGQDSLNHSDVIEIGASFIKDIELMGQILVQRFPILLIDESQDTNKDLIDSFLDLQAKHKNHLSLGLFGDMMQRIYFDGKANLSDLIPVDWARPKKVMNYRCPRRIVQLINRIRKDVDALEQQAKQNAIEGTARLFIAKSNTSNKTEIELNVMNKMAFYCADPLWNSTKGDIKILALEHHMSASRMGFLPFYEPLQKIDRYKTGLLDGSLPGIGLFLNRLLPIVRAHQSGNEFAKMQAIRNACAVFDKILIKAESNPKVLWEGVNVEIGNILAHWKDGRDPKLIDVLQTLATSNLFEIPIALSPLIAVSENSGNTSMDEDEHLDEEIQAWNIALSNPFSMFDKYAEYISGRARFGTHQGVKGLEFERVMVVIDDEEAKGFMFSYEKLFEVKEKTKTDLENEAVGNDTSIARTNRLFYVTCSRAEKSLAVLAYSQDPSKVKALALRKGWFDEVEIELI
jgi:DNA helicase-2/ATP-dependent DNA helicase PcrA